MTGVTRATLTRHVETWEKELTEIVQSQSENPLGISLRESDHAAHREDVDWLRKTADSLKSEVDSMESRHESLTELIFSLIDQMDFSPDDAGTVISLLNRYLEHNELRKKLISLFLQTQKRWQDSSAITSTISAFEVFQKEAMRRKAKADNATPPDPTQPTTGAVVATGRRDVFRRGQ